MNVNFPFFITLLQDGSTQAVCLPDCIYGIAINRCLVRTLFVELSIGLSC